MPGVILHLVAGTAMFIISRIYFNDYFEKNEKTTKLILLAGICLTFSFIPDFILGIYYTTHILPYKMLQPYHILTHIIFTPAAIVALLILKYKVDIKRGPIWITGFWCIVVHISMDLFIPDINVFF